MIDETGTMLRDVLAFLSELLRIDQAIVDTALFHADFQQCLIAAYDSVFRLDREALMETIAQQSSSASNQPQRDLRQSTSYETDDGSSLATAIPCGVNTPAVSSGQILDMEKYRNTLVALSSEDEKRQKIAEGIVHILSKYNVSYKDLSRLYDAIVLSLKCAKRKPHHIDGFFLEMVEESGNISLKGSDDNSC